MAGDKLFQGHLDGGIIASRPPCGVIALPAPKTFACLQEAAARQLLLDSWAQQKRTVQLFSPREGDVRKAARAQTVCLI